MWVLDPSYFVLFGIPCSECLFPHVRKFSAIIYLNKISASFSLFSFLDPYNVMYILVSLMVSHRPLIAIFTLFLSFSFFAPLIGWIPLPCSEFSDSFFFSLLDLVCPWSLILNFLFHLDYILQLYDFHLVHFSIFSLRVSFFMHCSPDFSKHIYDHYFEIFVG